MKSCPHCDQWHLRPDDNHCGSCGVCIQRIDFVDDSNYIPVHFGNESNEIKVSICLKNTGGLPLDLMVKSTSVSIKTNLHAETLRVYPDETSTLNLTIQGLDKTNFNKPDSRIYIESSSGLVENLRFFLPEHIDDNNGSQLVYEWVNLDSNINEEQIDELITPIGEKTIAYLRIHNPFVAYMGVEFNVDALPKSIKSLRDFVVVPPARDGGIFGKTLVPFNFQPTSENSDELNLDGDVVRVTYGYPKQLEDYPAIRHWCNTLVEDVKNVPNDLKDYFDLSDKGRVEDLDLPSTGHVYRKDPSIYLISSGNAPVKIVGSISLGRIMPIEYRRETFTIKYEKDVPFTVENIHLSSHIDNCAFTGGLDVAASKTLSEPDDEVSFSLRLDAKYYPLGDHSEQVAIVFKERETLYFDVNFSIQEWASYDGYVSIDFGTSNSCIACASDNTNASIVGSTYNGGRTMIPSVLYFLASDDPIMGYEALEKYRLDPSGGVANIKRVLKEGNLEFYGKEYTPAEIVQLMLRGLIGTATRELNLIPEKLVITVPVDFNEVEKAIIREAAILAFTYQGQISEKVNVTFLYEPVGSALHYIYTNPEKFETKIRDRPMHIMVYDFGGGTLDVCIVKILDTRQEVVSLKGKRNLGGVDIDRKIAASISDELIKIGPFAAFDAGVVKISRNGFHSRFPPHGSHSDKARKTRSKFSSMSEEVKIRLSAQDNQKFELSRDYIIDSDGKSIPLRQNDIRELEESGNGDWEVSSSSISHNSDSHESDFDENIDYMLCRRVDQEYFTRIIEGTLTEAKNIVSNSLEIAKLTSDKIDVLLLTGQVCYSEVVRSAITNMFEKGQGEQIDIPGPDKFSPKESVALGAAKFGVWSAGEELPGIKCTFSRLGYLETVGELKKRFVEVLPIKSPFGVSCDTPIRIDNEKKPVRKELGEKKPVRKELEIVANSSVIDEFHISDGQDVLEKIGKVVFYAGDEIYLGLDINGLLLATKGTGQILTIEFAQDRPIDNW